MFKAIKKVIKKTRFLLLKNKSFSIISDNCWGGFIYQYFNIPYKSPFVGLFIFSPDYIKMLKNLEYYLNSDLVFIEPNETRYKKELIAHGTYETYPIAILGDNVEIHFLHYKSNEEAYEKWSKRVKRLDRKNLIIKFCDRDLCTDELVDEFDKLDFENKVMLSSKDYKIDSNLKLKNETGDEVKNEWGSFLKTVSPVMLLNGFFTD